MISVNCDGRADRRTDDTAYAYVGLSSIAECDKNAYGIPIRNPLNNYRECHARQSPQHSRRVA